MFILRMFCLILKIPRTPLQAISVCPALAEWPVAGAYAGHLKSGDVWYANGVLMG